MKAKLYWFPLSHPAQAARRMLELKGIQVQDARVLPGMQLVHLRLAGFRGGTVPAVKLEGRRWQGSREIARALEGLRADPPLFPADPELRRRVQEAERWGEQQLQNVPRRILRWGLTADSGLRRWLADDAGMPLPALSARTSAPLSRLYARRVGADEAAARHDVQAVPRLLEQVDGLLRDGVLAPGAPNAAALQVLSSVRALDALTDLHQQVDSHACAAAARELFPDFPGPVPAFIPPEWLAAPEPD